MWKPVGSVKNIVAEDTQLVCPLLLVFSLVAFASSPTGGALLQALRPDGFLFLFKTDLSATFALRT